MSRKRSISSDISTDPRVAIITAQHGALPALLYTWAIPHADDWGRLSGDPVKFKLVVCPALNASTDEIDGALDQVAEAGLWQRYEVNGRSYIAYPRDAWFKHQSYINTSKRQDDSGSDHPAPPEWDDGEEQQETPRNTKEGQGTAENPASPSPSPSPSPSLSPSSEEGSVPNGTVSTATPYDDIVSLYNAHCPSLPRVQAVTDKRKDAMRVRWKKYGDLDTYKQVFSMAEESDFLSGRNGKWTSCNFDWLLKEANMVKVLEGAYDNRASPGTFKGLRDWAEKEGVLRDQA